MVQTSLFIPKKEYQNIYDSLLPPKLESEKAAFIFATIIRSDGCVNFQFKKWYSVKPHEYEYSSTGYLELKDEIRPKIIKMASDINAAIVELHSHTFSGIARFSFTDFQGFKEFVPHIYWRLKGKPYAAIVFSKSSFDALVWIDDPERYCQLTKIVVGKKSLYPSGASLADRNQNYE